MKQKCNILGKKLQSVILKNRFLLELAIIDFLLIAFAYSSFLKITFSSDNIYSFMEVGTKKLGVIDYCYGGRYTIFLFCKLLDLFGFDYLRGEIASQLFKMVSSVVLTLIVVKTFENILLTENDVLGKIIINCAVLIGVINVFYVETYIYVTPDWGLGLLLAGASYYSFVKNKYILAAILSFFTVSEYQMYLVVIGILSLTYLFGKNHGKISWKYLSECIKLSAILILAAALNLGLPRLFNKIGLLKNPTRNTILNSSITFKERVMAVWEVIVGILRNSLGMMPYKSVFIFICSILIIGILYALVKKNYLYLFNYCIHSAIILSSTFLISMIMSGVYLPSRILFPFYFSIGAVVILNLTLMKNEIWKGIYLIIILFFLTISVWNTKLASDDHLVSNTLDLEYAREIQEKISSYENQTGNKIEIIKILDWYDREKTWDYREFMNHNYVNTNYNLKLFYDDWSVVPTIEYISGRKYTLEYMTNEEYEKLFGEKEWSYIDLEKQIEFENNVAFLSIY